MSMDMELPWDEAVQAAEKAVRKSQRNKLAQDGLFALIPAPSHTAPLEEIVNAAVDLAQAAYRIADAFLAEGVRG